MNQNKISQYFFIIAAVVAILDGAFTLDYTMRSLKFILLVFSGIIVGALRACKQREFLLSSVAVIITGFILTETLPTTLSSFSIMIYNFVIFLSAATVVVGIEQIANILTIPHEEEPTPKEHFEKFKKLTSPEIKHLTFEYIWGVIILIAVALTFIVLLAESFFDVSMYANILLVVESLITLLFIIDVVLLYEKSKSFSEFIYKNIFDIIAAIPAVGVLQGLKLIRAVRIIRVMKSGIKVTKMTKMYKTTKFFSEESDFNKVNNYQSKKSTLTRKTHPKKKGKVNSRANSKANPKTKTRIKTVSVKKKSPAKKKVRKQSVNKKKLTAKKRPSQKRKTHKTRSKR